VNLWLQHHAWKLIPSACADPDHVARALPINDLPQQRVRRSVLVNHDVCPMFRAACDTVLTQDPRYLPALMHFLRRSAASTCAPPYNNRADNTRQQRSGQDPELCRVE